MRMVSRSRAALALVVSCLLAPGYIARNAAADDVVIGSPNWEVHVDEYGYSDLAFDLRPGYEWREYLSGELAAAVSYTRNSVPVGPKWLNPMFIYPDWEANSGFGIESVPGVSTNAFGFSVSCTVITNGAVRVRITSEMLDSTNGIPQGVSPRSNPVQACSISDRFVFRQRFEITNISGTSLVGFKFFKFIHSLQATTAVYDDRDYAPALGGYHYTVSQQGHDIGWVADSSLVAVHFDTVALHAKVPPSAWEVGRYGIEGTDSHEAGKPSVGVHLSVEAGSLSGLDSFSPDERWVSGAMRFDMGTLAAGAETNIQFLMTIKTVTAAQVGRWIGWGDNTYGQCDSDSETICKVAAGANHTVALHSDGTVTAWGDNSLGQTNVPPGLSNVVSIAAGGNHSLALTSDGAVIGWGDNTYGQIDVPGLSYTWAIAAGSNHSLALSSYGDVTAWGDNSYSQTNVPASVMDVDAIAAGGNHSLALLYDGTVVGWGDNSKGQTDVPVDLDYNVWSIAAGDNHSLASTYDDTAVAWGDNTCGQTNVPVGLTDVDTIAAGGNHSLALLYDGTVVAWGDNSKGQTEVPVGQGRVRVIAAGGAHSLALVPVPPRVGIGQSGVNSQISWSAAWAPRIEGTVLEQSSSLTGVWNEVVLPGAMVGPLFKVDVPNLEDCGYFRLRIP